MEYYTWESLRLMLFASIPQGWGYFIFSFAFITPQPAKLYKKVFCMIIIHSIYTEALMPHIPISVHMVNSQIALVVLLFLFFREIPKRKLLAVHIICMVSLITADIILVALAQEAFAIESRESLFSDHFLLAVTVIDALMILAFIASRFIRRRQSQSIKRLVVALQSAGRNPLITVVLLILIQFFFLAALKFTQHTEDRSNHLINSSIIYIVVLISLFIIGAVIRMIIRARESAIRLAQEVYVEDINGMFASIRGQRHEFINHLQVIHGMAQMNRPDQLKSYLSELVQESHKVNEIVRHPSPVLAAFVQAKLTIAEGSGIKFEYMLPEQWDTDRSTIKMIDIIKIWGNLVDNAFDETVLLPAGERYVCATIASVNGMLALEVSNSGKLLDKLQRETMFQPGFSTKGEGHSGLGLAIISERVKHYKGRIDVDPFGNSGITIRVLLPE